MELSVLVESTPDRGFRASSGEPLSASVQAPTWPPDELTAAWLEGIAAARAAADARTEAWEQPDEAAVS